MERVRGSQRGRVGGAGTGCYVREDLNSASCVMVFIKGWSWGAGSALCDFPGALEKARQPLLVCLGTLTPGVFDQHVRRPDVQSRYGQRVGSGWGRERQTGIG